MAALRQHGTTLIAGLVVLGAIAFAAIVAIFVYGRGQDPGALLRGLIWLVGAFAGAHLARRLLPELDIPSLCVAAAVVILLALGIQHQVARSPIDAMILVQLGLTFIGSLAGAWSARNVKAEVSPIVAVLGSGASAFGAGIVVLGIGVLISERAAIVALLIGTPLGGALTTRFARVQAIHTAIGQALLFGSFVALTMGDGLGPRLIIGAISAIPGWIAGAIGGALGVALRPRRSAPDLPAARKLE